MRGAGMRTVWIMPQGCVYYPVYEAVQRMLTPAPAPTLKAKSESIREGAVGEEGGLTRIGEGSPKEKQKDIVANGEVGRGPFYSSLSIVEGHRKKEGGSQAEIPEGEGGESTKGGARTGECPADEGARRLVTGGGGGKFQG